jgi:pyrimidine operon attenuation protein/uracil phosphoribosyltransferase
MLGLTTVGAITGLAIACSFALFMLAATLVMLRLSRTLSITNHFLDDVRKQTIPLMTRFQTTMDHVNKELELVDGIMASGEKVASRVNAMTKVAQKVVSSPLFKIIGVGAGVQKAIAPRGGGEEEAEAAEDQD